MTTINESPKVSKKLELPEHTLAICGDGAVGKSSMTVSFLKHTFESDYDPTIEDAYRCQIKVDNEVCMLNIIDTAGQDEYKALRSGYMRQAEGFIFVFDMTNKHSLETLMEYKLEVERIKDTSNFPVVLCGNKCDLVSEFFEDAVKLAENFKKQHLNDCPFFLTSALQRINIDEAFHATTREVMKRHRKSTEDKKDNVQEKMGLFSSFSNPRDVKSDLEHIRSVL